MSRTTFTLLQQPAQRVDLAALVPEQLTGRSEAEISRMEVQTTRERLRVGELFRVRLGDPQQIEFDGGSERFDRVGFTMRSGEIRVEGDVGSQAGRLMNGGRLRIDGNAGPWAGSGMRAGILEIGGSAGERLGGPLAGETAGMRGGLLVVRGRAGPRAGDRLRRGLILVEGDAGDYPGSRMIAGTLVIGRRAGALPGYLMARGSIVLAGGFDRLSPTFVDCGVHDLLAGTLLARELAPFSPALAGIIRMPSRRLLGDMAVLGQGELLLPG